MYMYAYIRVHTCMHTSLAIPSMCKLFPSRSRCISGYQYELETLHWFGQGVVVVLERNGLTLAKYLTQAVILQGVEKRVGQYFRTQEGNIFPLVMEAQSDQGFKIFSFIWVQTDISFKILKSNSFPFIVLIFTGGNMRFGFQLTQFNFAFHFVCSISYVATKETKKEKRERFF